VVILTWFAKTFGKEAVAGMGLGTRIEQIILLPAIGISTAMLSITGQCLGAGVHGRIRDAWYLCLKLSVSSMILGGIVLIACSGPVLGFFTHDPKVIVHGRIYLLVSGLTLAAYPILFSTVFMMQGLRKPLYGLIMGLYRQIVGPVLLLTLLIKIWHLGVLWVWVGFGIVTWSAAAVALMVGFTSLKALGIREG
jgi:Na+-driven multidrug efflux pump